LNPGERAALVVEGTVIEFERMAGASGWKATGSNRAIWNRMPLPAFIHLALAIQIPISRVLDHSPPSDPARAKDSSRRRLSEACFVGVDVGGRADKGYTLARTLWRGGQLTSIDFASLPHHDVLPPTNELRPLVRAGDLDELARRTHETARSRARDLWAVLDAWALDGVFIDSPSAFARNVAGHGRRCEKASIPGVSFQSTPSIACGMAHQGEWGWLVYGMIAFAAVWSRGVLDLGHWVLGLTSGLHAPTRSLTDPAVRECFPTATVAVLRERGRGRAVLSALETAPASRELEVVRLYLERGVQGNKRPRDPAYDRADALIAALSGLPWLDSTFVESEPMPSAPNWEGSTQDAAIEGRIALIH
jgi:hypothetical protein